MELDYSSLARAIASMERASRFVQKRMQSSSLAPDEAEILKAAIIQNFEFTYELCWKFIKRWLDFNYSSSLTAGLSRKQLFRYAVENRLIEDLEVWLVYHELLNRTSHTYNQLVADEIFAASDTFLSDARNLLNRLEASDA